MASKVQVGNLAKISGEVNIAAGNIVKNIRTIYERALTAAEEAARARSLENKLLAEGVSSYLQRLQQQTKHREESAIPYKGLLEYRLEDARAFYGRSAAIHDLLVVIDRGPLTILHAESGAGKTSLLQAGIAPRILAHEHLPITLRPYNKLPSEALKRVFLPDLRQSPLLAKAPLRDFLSRVNKILGSKTSLYVLIDQFEEFFNQIDQKEQKVFIDDLAECLDDASLNVHWLISLRTEYHGRLGNFQPRIRNVYENDYLLNRLTRDEAREAIMEPAKQHNIRFEKGLPDRIINELCKHKEEVAPPQLQLVCSALFETLREDEKTISMAIYEREGAANGILKGHLERVLKRLPPPQRSAALQVLEELITSVQQRAVCSREKLIDSLSSRGIDVSTAGVTINQLVENRLLRADEADEGITYELSHDYLLDEIRVTPEVKNRKQAEELLEQGLSNWREHQLLIAPDAQKVIEAEMTNLLVSPEEAKLLFLSAIEYKLHARKWGELISPDQRNKLIASYFQEKGTRKSRDGLWALRDYLSPIQKTSMTVNKAAIILLRLSWRVTVFLLATAMAIVIVAIIPIMTIDFIKWSQSLNYYEQCLDENRPSNAIVAIDASDPSHIVVYDSKSNKLCESGDTGMEWTAVSNDILLDKKFNSIAVNEGIYLATNQELYHQVNDGKWETMAPPKASPFLQAMTVSPDKRDIYIVDSKARVFKYGTETRAWNEVDLGDITGEITDLSINSYYFAVSTTDGIWYTRLDDKIAWIEFDNKLKEEVEIASIALAYQNLDWKALFVNPLARDKDKFLASTPTGDVYIGYLTETGGLTQKTHLLFENKESALVSIAVNRYSKFATSSDELLCEQSWTILNSEWWHFDLRKDDRCG